MIYKKNVVPYYGKKEKINKNNDNDNKKGNDELKNEKENKKRKIDEIIEEIRLCQKLNDKNIMKATQAFSWQIEENKLLRMELDDHNDYLDDNQYKLLSCNSLYYSKAFKSLKIYHEKTKSIKYFVQKRNIRLKHRVLKGLTRNMIIQHSIKIIEDRRATYVKKKILMLITRNYQVKKHSMNHLYSIIKCFIKLLKINCLGLQFNRSMIFNIKKYHIKCIVQAPKVRQYKKQSIINRIINKQSIKRTLNQWYLNSLFLKKLNLFYFKSIIRKFKYEHNFKQTIILCEYKNIKRQHIRLYFNIKENLWRKTQYNLVRKVSMKYYLNNSLSNMISIVIKKTKVKEFMQRIYYKTYANMFYSVLIKDYMFKVNQRLLFNSKDTVNEINKAIASQEQYDSRMNEMMIEMKMIEKEIHEIMINNNELREINRDYEEKIEEELVIYKKKIEENMKEIVRLQITLREMPSVFKSNTNIIEDNQARDKVIDKEKGVTDIKSLIENINNKIAKEAIGIKRNLSYCQSLSSNNDYS